MSKLCKVCLGTGKTVHAFPDVCINCDGLGIMPTCSKEFVREGQGKIKTNRSNGYGREEREELKL